MNIMDIRRKADAAGRLIIGSNCLIGVIPSRVMGAMLFASSEDEMGNGVGLVCVVWDSTCCLGVMNAAIIITRRRRETS